MAPGPPDKFSNNRFAVLGDFMNIPHKKLKPNEYPELPTSYHNNKNNPKYIVISSTDPNKTLANISPFIIKKGIENISTELTSITALRDGNILILTPNARVADKFLKSKTLSNVCPISCKLHDTLNTVKGVIYAPCLISVPEQEIIQEMKSQGVIDVFKFTKPSADGKSRVPSGKMIITFDLHRLPTSVEVAWYKCKVDFYFPNPMRCKNCQKLGHTKNRCKGDPTCPTCSLPPHEPLECTRISCTNCSGQHSSTDVNCPRYIQTKEILKIKAKYYCSIGEARRKYRELNPVQSTPLINSFAFTTSNQVNNREISTEITSSKPSKTTSPNNIINKKTTATVNQPTNTHKTPSIQTEITKTQEATQSTITLKAADDKILKKTTTHNTKATNDIIVKNSITLANNEIINKEINNHQLTNSVSNSISSPISHLTQSLINNNKYFIPSIDGEDSDDDVMDCISTEPQHKI